MTVSSELMRKEYTGAGTTGPFSFPYYFISDADLTVIKRTIATGEEQVLALTTDYTVTGAGNPAGGSITTVAAVTSSYEIVIFRDPALTQDESFPEGDPFPSTVVELTLDKLIMAMQRVRDIANRSMRLSDGDTSGDDLTLPTDRASMYLAFDADGNPVATAGTTSDIIASAFAETLLDDADAAAMLTTLGVSAFIQTLLNDANADTALTTLGAKLAAQLAPGASGNVMRSNGAGAWEAGAAPGSLTEVFDYTMNPYAISTVISSGYTGTTRHIVESITLECKTAELGYSVGDIVDYKNPALVGVSTAVAASVSCWIVTAGTLPAIPHKGTGASTNITAANWKMRVRLYKIN